MTGRNRDRRFNVRPGRRSNLKYGNIPGPAGDGPSVLEIGDIPASGARRFPSPSLPQRYLPTYQSLRMRLLDHEPFG
jgi:hypothetical protein